MPGAGRVCAMAGSRTLVKGLEPWLQIYAGDKCAVCCGNLGAGLQRAAGGSKGLCIPPPSPSATAIEQ